MAHGGKEAALRLAGGVGHFLGAHHCAHQVLLRGDVGEGVEHLGRTCLEFARGDHRPEALAVLAHEFDLFVENFAVPERLARFFLGLQPVFDARIQHIGAAVDQRTGLGAEQPFHRGVAAHEYAVAHQRDRRRRGLQQHFAAA